MNAIVPVWQVTEWEMTLLTTLSEKLHKSKALPAQLDNPEKVFMVLLTGRDLGLSPTQSLNGLYIVNGKVSIYGETAALLMKRAGYVIQRWECDSKSATVTIRHKDTPDQKHTETYTMAEAQYAKIVRNVWLTHPKTMLRWKALANARKLFAPECLGGYLIKEELDGEVVNVDEVHEPLSELASDFGEVEADIINPSWPELDQQIVESLKEAANETSKQIQDWVAEPLVELVESLSSDDKTDE